MLWDQTNTNERVPTVGIHALTLLDIQRTVSHMTNPQKITSLDLIIGSSAIVDYVKLTLVYLTIAENHGAGNLAGA